MMLMWWLWPIILLGSLTGLHFWWRARYRALEQRTNTDLTTYQQRQQQGAQDMQAQQQVIFNSMLEGLLLLDRQRKITLVNRTFETLFQIKSDLRGKTVMEALRQHELADLVVRAEKERQVFNFELKPVDRHERWLQVNAAAITNASGGIEGTILVFHDLTRLKQLERQREEFVANVSHELRTPLSLIKGYVETLLDGAKENPEVADKFLKTIERNTRRLDLLIQDLLTISALESGRLKLELQPVNLRTLTEKVFADLGTKAESRNIRLACEIANQTAHGDIHRLDQVLANLVDNAIKYGRTGGVVMVTAKTLSPEQIEVCVQDDGPGIPAEALERVFERFYRVDKARSRDQGGTGLGLAIVKHIVQSHGGKVWARSEPGKGAGFYFTLPVAHAEAAQ
jgi:two-component system, OmpR family, phosphate regulon sensor histidine kinase PhoR